MHKADDYPRYGGDQAGYRINTPIIYIYKYIYKRLKIPHGKHNVKPERIYNIPQVGDIPRYGGIQYRRSCKDINSRSVYPGRFVRAGTSRASSIVLSLRELHIGRVEYQKKGGGGRCNGQTAELWRGRNGR